MITIMFSCGGCGLVKRKVQVPARETADQDVVEWMRQVVARCISAEHQKLSPHCMATTMRDLMIPLPKEGEFIGQQIE